MVLLQIKDKFLAQMSGVIVSALNTFRKSGCKQGRITSTEDFKFLAKKVRSLSRGTLAVLYGSPFPAFIGYLDDLISDVMAICSGTIPQYPRLLYFEYGANRISGKCCLWNLGL